MADRIDAFHFGLPERQLFGVFHPAHGVTRAVVLMCPPLLHEQVRSYRFFAGVATLLAESGLACLRFDYFGTGDSGGDSAGFRPAQAGQDIMQAAATLRERADGAPLILMGIRASALLAAAQAADVYASALWLWQPVRDAVAYLDELDALDAAERSSRLRYPLLEEGPAAEPHELMGFVLAPSFRDELASLGTGVPTDGCPVAVLDAADAWPGTRPTEARITLPPAVTDWVGQVEMGGLVPVGAARDAVRMLVGDLSTWA